MIERYALDAEYSISRLIHGGWQFSAGHRLAGGSLDDALEVLTESVELGVTAFDCADIYTGVEELYGHLLSRWKTTSSSTEIQIHTKFVPDDSDLPRVDRAYVGRIVDRSLSRLGVERLDLVQFYWWRDEIPGVEQTAIWLDELRREGKIRHLAATNLDVDRLARIRAAGVDLVTDQVQYSLLDRRAESGLQEYCRTTGMKIIAFGALAGGFLTDRWLGRVDEADPSNRSLVKYRLIIDEFGGWEAYQSLLDEVRSIADEHGVEASAVALRFVLDQPAVAAVITGATRAGQMRRNAEAFTFSLTEDQHARIRAHVDAAPGPAGDVFGLERDRSGPHGSIMKYDLNRE